MIVVFILAMIAGVCIMLRNITDIKPIDVSSSNIDAVETISTELSTTVETTSITTSITVTSSLTSTVTSTSYAETEIETSGVSTVITTTEDIIISIINPQIIVIPDETTVKSTKATTSTTASKTTTCVTTTTQVVIGNEDVRSGANFVKTFTRGTYYPGWEAYGSTQVYGGSGRLLMDCSIKDDEIKGSVACKYIQEKYGYNYNGARTIVYLDIPELPDMSGFYFIDDSCLWYDTIDFYFTYKANCPFMTQGVLTNISCYIVPNGSVS